MKLTFDIVTGPSTARIQDSIGSTAEQPFTCPFRVKAQGEVRQLSIRVTAMDRTNVNRPAVLSGVIRMPSGTLWHCAISYDPRTGLGTLTATDGDNAAVAA